MSPLALCRRYLGLGAPRPGREVFRVTVAGDRLRFDPAEVRRRLADARPDWADIAARMGRGRDPLDPSLAPAEALARAESIEADFAVLATAVTAAFGLDPLTASGGYTEAERVTVLGEYLLYCAEIHNRRKGS